MRLTSGRLAFCFAVISCASVACNDPQSTSKSNGGAPDFAHAKRIELVYAFLYDSFSSGDGGTHPDVHDGDLALAIRGGRGHVRYIGQFGCGDPYEARLLREGPNAYVLLRFTGPGHNACGAAFYAMQVVLDPADAHTRITVYRQDDANGPIKAVGSASAGASDADCAGLLACSTDAPCRLGAPGSEVLPVDQPEDTYACATLDVCGGSTCVWMRQACMMTCGKADCAILESFPVQVSCGG